MSNLSLLYLVMSFLFQRISASMGVNSYYYTGFEIVEEKLTHSNCRRISYLSGCGVKTDELSVIRW